MPDEDSPYDEFLQSDFKKKKKYLKIIILILVKLWLGYLITKTKC